MTVGEGVEAGKFVLRSLWPPPPEADDRRIRKWRFAVFYTVIIMAVSMSTFVAWSVGALAAFGFYGFAYADDQSQIRTAMVAIQNSNLTRDIRDMKRQQCIAMEERDQSVLNFATQTLEDLKDDYRKVNNRDASVPACPEVLIGAEPKNSR